MVSRPRRSLPEAYDAEFCAGRSSPHKTAEAKRLAFSTFLGCTLACTLPRKVSSSPIGLSCRLDFWSVNDVLLVLLLPVLLWRWLNWAADNVHFGLTAGLGAGQLCASSRSSDGNFVAYDWSVGLAGGPNALLSISLIKPCRKERFSVDPMGQYSNADSETI